jgi:two-component system, NtrC family, nitrogen regulation sensor histidine kinase NtrY
MSPPRSRRLAHDARVFFLALAGGLPAVIVAVALLWAGDYSEKVRWTLAALVGGTWLACAVVLRERVVHPIQTLSNMLAALREGDFSIRGRTTSREDPLGLAYHEANILSETLRQQRLGALEATALLRRVMEEIDTAVFAFDAQRRLRLVNRAGARLLGRPEENLLGRDAPALGLAEAFEGDPPRVVDLAFPGGTGKWVVRRGEFRQAGVPHHLVVLSDVTRTLRDEERGAWQRLVRVLSHEINNSLTPIKSIAESLRAQLAREARPAGFEDDLQTGLNVIAARSEALTRFMASYARLARLPRPKPGAVDVGAWVCRAASLETRMPVVVEPGPERTIEADPDQLEQLLINLVRNGVDAVLELPPARGAAAPAGVRVRWRASPAGLVVEVEDDGPGLAQTENLFVPFFTTKAAGSGVGLALGRQIAEAHGGTLTLQNRDDARGAIARLRLPLAEARIPAAAAARGDATT